LPAGIGNLINLKELRLDNNSLTKLPSEILKIKDRLIIYETSYQIDNMDPEAEFIILSCLKTKITNLPFNLKEIWLKEGINASLIKVPFGCKIKYFL
jgi:Leucine-rich repeat (LRR) protein